MPAAAAPTRTPNATRWIVLLTEKPVAEQYPGRIEKIRDTAAPYRLHLQQVQAGLRPQIEGMHVRVTGALQHLLNGIFVVATPAQAATLRKLPGVKAAVPMVQFRKADQLSMSNDKPPGTDRESAASRTRAPAARSGLSIRALTIRIRRSRILRSPRPAVP